jgi:hypothetical protein
MSAARRLGREEKRGKRNGVENDSQGEEVLVRYLPHRLGRRSTGQTVCVCVCVCV